MERERRWRRGEEVESAVARREVIVAAVGADHQPVPDPSCAVPMNVRGRDRAAVVRAACLAVAAQVVEDARAAVRAAVVPCDDVAVDVGDREIAGNSDRQRDELAWPGKLARMGDGVPGHGFFGGG
jgi:hypothetical protein